MNGTFNNFNMCIDPLVVYPSFYFMDINTLTSNVPLKTGVMNGFKLDQASLPGNWLDYWDGKGVNAWQHPAHGSTSCGRSLTETNRSSISITTALTTK
ncbi:MAG: hypothetical protein MZV63_56140 [Marinilabiliales bacterium]|nr:hypothetical protein [Marinilabiliales bacterium]